MLTTQWWSTSPACLLCQSLLWQSALIAWWTWASQTSSSFDSGQKRSLLAIWWYRWILDINEQLHNTYCDVLIGKICFISAGLIWVLIRIQSIGVEGSEDSNLISAEFDLDWRTFMKWASATVSTRWRIKVIHRSTSYTSKIGVK